MSNLVLLILIFIAAGLTVLAANLVLGRLVRPDKPSPEKGEVYECGEQPFGSADVQFDIRFYVVALLFVIFDVELAFFFPWAVVFGSATRAADESRPEPERAEAGLVVAVGQAPAHGENAAATPSAPDPKAMRKLAWMAFADILVFFGVLLVGFAYLWRRGDLKWVRSLAHDARDTT
jgi:NADH-quinone oxidoreductase subunit A